jgi:hypothetical protein
MTNINTFGNTIEGSRRGGGRENLKLAALHLKLERRDFMAKKKKAAKKKAEKKEEITVSGCCR